MTDSITFCFMYQIALKNTHFDTDNITMVCMNTWITNIQFLASDWLHIEANTACQYDSWNIFWFKNSCTIYAIKTQRLKLWKFLMYSKLETHNRSFSYSLCSQPAGGIVVYIKILCSMWPFLLPDNQNMLLQKDIIITYKLKYQETLQT